jgi:hypothetical protein
MWSTVEKLIQDKPGLLYEHCLKSYHYFCDHEVLEIVQQKVKCDKIRFQRANSADEARRCNTTYQSNVFATVSGKEDVFIFSLPVMVGSKLDDPSLQQMGVGGFFIINGKECCVKLKEVWDPASAVVMKSSPGSKYGWTSAENGLVVGVVADTETERHGEVEVVLPGSKCATPLFVLMRGLGVLSDRDIVAHCLLGRSDSALLEAFRPSVHAAGQIFSYAAATAVMDEGAKAWVNADREAKAYQVGRLVARVLKVSCGREPVDKEEDLTKRAVLTCGDFLKKKVGKFWAEHLSKKPEERDLEKHCLTDDVGKGVVSAFLRSKLVTWVETPSFFSRMGAVRNVAASKRLHPTHYGFYDAYEVGQMALSVRITGES